MRARPKRDFGRKSIFDYNVEADKWMNEAEVSLNAGDYLIGKQRQEIKELKVYKQAVLELSSPAQQEFFQKRFEILNKH